MLDSEVKDTIQQGYRQFLNNRGLSPRLGQKQMVANARAIIEKRKLILIDEPTKGLVPAIIDNMIEAFQEFAIETTILLVEQNFYFASSLGQTVAVVDDGRIVHQSSMEAFVNDKDLQTRLLSLSLDQHQ